MKEMHWAIEKVKKRDLQKRKDLPPPSSLFLELK
jgi:hypothetical protein